MKSSFFQPSREKRFRPSLERILARKKSPKDSIESFVRKDSQRTDNPETTAAPISSFQFLTDEIKQSSHFFKQPFNEIETDETIPKDSPPHDTACSRLLVLCHRRLTRRQPVYTTRSSKINQ